MRKIQGLVLNCLASSLEQVQLERLDNRETAYTNNLLDVASFFQNCLYKSSAIADEEQEVVNPQVALMIAARIAASRIPAITGWNIALTRSMKIFSPSSSLGAPELVIN